MIESAEEFIQLRSSEVPEEYHRAAHESASYEIWLDVIERYPDMAFWVAHNKTVPIEILALLATYPDARVRSMVARKRKLTPELLEQLSYDEGIRLDVACHRKTPRAVLERLCHDSWDKVAQHARERLAQNKNG